MTGHLCKDWSIESWKSKEPEAEEAPELEPEPEKAVTRSKGGRTFRRRQVDEAMTPADAILQSTAVNPDLEKALLLVKGIA